MVLDDRNRDRVRCPDRLVGMAPSTIAGISHSSDRARGNCSHAPCGADVKVSLSRHNIDVWIARSGSAVAELCGCHTQSHSHCRVAFSLTDGLILLPNESALGL